VKNLFGASQVAAFAGAALFWVKGEIAQPGAIFFEGQKPTPVIETPYQFYSGQFLP
jgi:hypothetical protein